MSACRSCGAVIVWARSEKSGAPIPVSATRVPYKGTIQLRDGDAGADPIAHFVTKAERVPRVDMGLYSSHFADCPNAQRHRKAFCINIRRVNRLA